MIKLISYNVNGIRAAIKKDLIGWLKKEKPHIFCIQESKSQEDQVDTEQFEKLGYQAHWHSAVKKGYSGVITFTKIKPDKVVSGIGMEKYDNEGRVLRTDFGKWTLLNCYFPSGSSGEERHKFKMEFLYDFGPWVKKLLKKRPHLVIVGDYNIVHGDLDIHNPQRRDQPSGFKPEERAWLDNWFKSDFQDAYRMKHPKKIQFSWWSYRSGARKNNKGWRIDYISVSNKLKENIKGAKILNEVVHSDHCPIMVKLDL